MNDNLINRISMLYRRLDSMTDSNQIKRLLRQEINSLIAQGYSKQEIKDIFRTELLTEQQSIDAMTANHQDYVDMIEAILGA